MTDDARRADLEARYPMSEKQRERVRTRSGRPFADLSLDNVLAGEVGAGDFGITAQGLREQAAIAEAAGRPSLGQNLRRGAEIVHIPEEKLLAIYELLRPGRAESAGVLRAAAEDLRRMYGAEAMARLVEEAAEVYERRGVFQRRY
jgi:propanediol dehydratase small subunit